MLGKLVKFHNKTYVLVGQDVGHTKGIFLMSSQAPYKILKFSWVKVHNLNSVTEKDLQESFVRAARGVTVPPVILLGDWFPPSKYLSVTGGGIDYSMELNSETMIVGGG